MGFKFEKLSMLVVEDILPMQKLVVSVLETMGIGRIRAASNGEQGFKLFCDEKPDIVLTDWHMIPMSGMELVQKIRNEPGSPNKTIPIILMTGYSALPRVSEARDAGATEFLVKPFSANDLAKRIAYVINKPRDFIDSNVYFGPDRRRRKVENYTGPKRRQDER
jgi:two-component system, chemotaxis family, chemotaxis protein CheY